MYTSSKLLIVVAIIGAWFILVPGQDMLSSTFTIFPRAIHSLIILMEIYT